MISSAEACLGINQISDLPKAERKILDLETTNRYPKQIKAKAHQNLKSKNLSLSDIAA